MSKRSWIIALVVALPPLFYGGEAAAQALCTTTEGEQIVNSLFDDATPVLNAAWPSIAVATGLDPYLDVWDGYVGIGCKYGGDEICGLQAAKCDWFRLYVRVKKITGLAGVKFSDLQMASLTATAGTQNCPFSTKPYTNSCSYQGDATGAAALVTGGEIRVEADKVKVKVKCDWGFLGTSTETVWPASGAGAADCKASKVTGSATMSTCAGTCASGSPLAALEGLKTTALKFHNNNLKCDVSPAYSPVSWIADVAIPLLEQNIIKAVTPPIEDAMNSLFNSEMPLPGVCQ